MSAGKPEKKSKVKRFASFRRKKDENEFVVLEEQSRRKSMLHVVTTEADTSAQVRIRRTVSRAGRNRRSRSVSPVMAELRDKLAHIYTTRSYNNVHNQIPEDQPMRPRLATTSITPGHVTAASRQLTTQPPLPDITILRYPNRLQPPKSPIQRPYSHQHPKQGKSSHLYRQATQGPWLPKVNREGPIDKVKLSPNGVSKLPKHWSSGMQGLLTESGLFFAEDKNALLAMKSGVAGVCKDKIDLRGAKINRDIDHIHSAKRNVNVITALDGTIALIQNDDPKTSDNWFCDIHAVISKHQDHSSSSETSPGPVTRNALNWFFKKRPPKETLVNQGIYKNEPIFGNTLERLYEASEKREPVPKFVERCTDILENPPHVFSIGLYRTSGNLSHIQKLRLRVDQEDEVALDDLTVASDSDVLVGALKLFFRELQTPLVPYPIYMSLSEACGIVEPDKRLAKAKESLKKLSEAHKQTLACLCAHLLRITVHEKQNQMSTANLAIVWGPSFTWPDENAGPKALHQCTDVNRVVQYLIEESPLLFPTYL
ncbi:Cd GTPase activating protein-related [Carabus blaptoides fortunei]